MILLILFLVFLQIGSLAFGGGYAILPFIQNIVVDGYGWLNIKEMTDIVTISQMTPGPIAINAATFVGTKMAGIVGSIVSTLSTILPQIIIMTLLAKLFFSNKKIGFMDNIIKSLRPAVASLIFIASINMIKGSVFKGAQFDVYSISLVAFISFIIGFILFSRKVGIIKLIVLGAILGIVLTLLQDKLLFI